MDKPNSGDGAPPLIGSVLLDWNDPPQVTVQAIRDAIKRAAATALPDDIDELQRLNMKAGAHTLALETALGKCIEELRHMRGTCGCAGTPKSDDHTLMWLRIDPAARDRVLVLLDETQTVLAVWLHGMALDARAFFSPAVVEYLQVQAKAHDARTAAVAANVIAACKVGS